MWRPRAQKKKKDRSCGSIEVWHKLPVAYARYPPYPSRIVLLKQPVTESTLVLHVPSSPAYRRACGQECTRVDHTITCPLLRPRGEQWGFFPTGQESGLLHTLHFRGKASEIAEGSGIWEEKRGQWGEIPVRMGIAKDKVVRRENGDRRGYVLLEA